MEGDSSIDKRLELIDRQREAVRQQMKQMKQMQETLDMLEYKHWYYETAKRADTCDIHKNMPEKDIPKKYREIRKKQKP